MEDFADAQRLGREEVINRFNAVRSRRGSGAGIDVGMTLMRVLPVLGQARATRSGVAFRLDSVEWGNLPVFGGEQGHCPKDKGDLKGFGMVRRAGASVQ
jgi:hypothetical protein